MIPDWPQTGNTSKTLLILTPISQWWRAEAYATMPRSCGSEAQTQGFMDARCPVPGAHRGQRRHLLSLSIHSQLSNRKLMSTKRRI